MMEKKTATRPVAKRLDTDSLVVQTFEVAQAVVRDGFASIDITCAVNTQWVCGTGVEVCPAC